MTVKRGFVMPKNEASHSNLTTLFLLRKPEASTIKVKAISLELTIEEYQLRIF
jgi:hypothetical protein